MAVPTTCPHCGRIEGFREPDPRAAYSVGMDPAARDADALAALPEAEHLRWMLAELRGKALAVLNRTCSERTRAEHLLALAKCCDLTADAAGPQPATLALVIVRPCADGGIAVQSCPPGVSVRVVGWIENAEIRYPGGADVVGPVPR